MSAIVSALNWASVLSFDGCFAFCEAIYALFDNALGPFKAPEIIEIQKENYSIDRFVTAVPNQFLYWGLIRWFQALVATFFEMVGLVTMPPPSKAFYFMLTDADVTESEKHFRRENHLTVLLGTEKVFRHNPQVSV